MSCRVSESRELLALPSEGARRLASARDAGEETRDQVGAFLVARNGLCPPSPAWTCRFLEGSSKADSSVSLPHPADYFAESWYSVRVAYWRCPWKPGHRMTEGICVLCLRHVKKGQSCWSRVLTRMAPGAIFTCGIQSVPPSRSPPRRRLPSLVKQTIWGNLLDLGVSLVIEMHWACGVTALSLGIWGAVAMRGNSEQLSPY